MHLVTVIPLTALQWHHDHQLMSEDQQVPPPSDTPQIEDSPPIQALPDGNANIVKILIHSAGMLRPDPYMIHPVIRVHLVGIFNLFHALISEFILITFDDVMNWAFTHRI